jgi:hypothetical protein
MPGLRKRVIADRINEVLGLSNVAVERSSFEGLSGDLPWACSLLFAGMLKRDYDMYFWTIGHGGRNRAQEEYRIQAKLKHPTEFRFGNGTTVLIGYYNESTDSSGRREGNRPPGGMEVFATWDAVQHGRPGESSSCQVPFGLLYRAHLTGKAEHLRMLSNGVNERVIAFRPEFLASYLFNVCGGHGSIDLNNLDHQSRSLKTLKVMS